MLDTFEPVVRFLAQYQGGDYVKGWAELWDKGDLIDWDKGFPNPALEDTLIQRRSIIGDSVVKDAGGSQYRRKALVPGCGRGVDVLLLASFGYDAYGLEYSHSAVETCKKEESERGGRYPIRNLEFGRGSVTFVQGDFFDDAWLDALGLLPNAFDLVYDHSVSRPVRLSICTMYCWRMIRESSCTHSAFGSFSVPWIHRSAPDGHCDKLSFLSPMAI